MARAERNIQCTHTSKSLHVPSKPPEYEGRYHRRACTASHSFASTGTMRQTRQGGDDAENRRPSSRPIGSAGMKTAPLRASQRSCSQIHHEALLLAARLSAGPGRLGEKIRQQRRGQGADLGARKVPLIGPGAGGPSTTPCAGNVF